LTFDYTFEEDNDKVFFAYNEPYTFTQLTQLLEQIKLQQDNLPKEEQYVRCETLCKSIGGIEIPMLTITKNINSELTNLPTENQLIELIESDISEWEADTISEFRETIREKIKIQYKKIVIVTARIHPGEACGSHVMEGFIKFITSSHPISVEMRDRMIIKIIPMMNIDGVIAGNYRCCLSGQDLNRKFTDTDIKMFPIILAIKKLIGEYKVQKKDIFGYIDLHGHSTKKCSFIYGPYYPLHSDKYVRVRILAKLLSDKTKMFRYPACKFRQEHAKINTARLVISREFDVMNSLTLENSFYGFLNEERKTVEYCVAFYESIGKCLVYVIIEYLHLLDEEMVTRMKRQFENKKKKKVLSKHKLKVKNKYQEILKKGMQTEDVKKDVHVKLIESPKVTLNKEEEMAQNPNEPTERKVIRLEECYQNSDIFLNTTKDKPRKMIDIFNYIKESAKDELEDPDSDSNSSECNSLTKEEEADLAKNILLAIQELPLEDVSNGEKVTRASLQREVIPRRVFTAPKPERSFKLAKQKINKLKEMEFPELPCDYTLFHPKQTYVNLNKYKDSESAMKSVE